jgi:serine/threonine protein kinase
MYDVILFTPDGSDIKRNLFGHFIENQPMMYDIIHHFTPDGSDIKPENFLLSGDKRTLYLCDFGFATTHIRTRRHEVGTVPYIAPECFPDAERPEHVADINWQVRSLRESRFYLWIFEVCTRYNASTTERYVGIVISCHLAQFVRHSRPNCGSR